jgi:hypothetical protein
LLTACSTTWDKQCEHNLQKKKKKLNSPIVKRAVVYIIFIFPFLANITETKQSKIGQKLKGQPSRTKTVFDSFQKIVAKIGQK